MDLADGIRQRSPPSSDYTLTSTEHRRRQPATTHHFRQLFTLASDVTNESASQTRLRVSMLKEAFRLDDPLLGTMQKLFSKMSPNGQVMCVQDFIHFSDYVLGIRRAQDDQFSKEYNATLRVKYWDILGNCYTTLPQLIANFKGVPSEFLPNIFVGTNFIALDDNMLRELRVTHTIDCSLVPNRVLEGITSTHVPLDDAVVLEGAEVEALLADAFRMADEVAGSKDKVLLIHDPIGLVKTCVFCVCYLMKRRGWSLSQAYYYARSRVSGFSIGISWALFRSAVNYALFLNPNEVIPPDGIMLYADEKRSAGSLS